MKLAYFLAIAAGAQDGGNGGTPHDPEAMAFCQGKFTHIGKFPRHELDQYSDEFSRILSLKYRENFWMSFPGSGNKG